MTANCPHYKIDIQHLESNEASPTPHTVTVKTPWCAHPNSPAPYRIATGVVGGANLLTCGGIIERCAIPQNKR